MSMHLRKRCDEIYLALDFGSPLHSVEFSVWGNGMTNTIWNRSNGSFCLTFVFVSYLHLSKVDMLWRSSPPTTELYVMAPGASQSSSHVRMEGCWVFLAPVYFINDVIFAVDLGQGHMEESCAPPVTQNDWKYLLREHDVPCTSCFACYSLPACLRGCTLPHRYIIHIVLFRHGGNVDVPSITITEPYVLKYTSCTAERVKKTIIFF